MLESRRNATQAGNFRCVPMAVTRLSTFDAAILQVARNTHHIAIAVMIFRAFRNLPSECFSDLGENN